MSQRGAASVTQSARPCLSAASAHFLYLCRLRSLPCLPTEHSRSVLEPRRASPAAAAFISLLKSFRVGLPPLPFSDTHLSQAIQRRFQAGAYLLSKAPVWLNSICAPARFPCVSLIPPLLCLPTSRLVNFILNSLPSLCSYSFHPLTVSLTVMFRNR